jgi:hypothetical protein
MRIHLLVLAIFVCVFDIESQTTFQKIYSVPNIYNSASTVKTNDGGYLLTGTTTDNAYDVYVIKTDSQGTVQWRNIYGGTSTDYALNIAATKDGGSIVCGYTDSDSLFGNRALLLKLDAAGNIQWTKSYGRDDEYAYSVIQTWDKGYLAVGTSGTQSTSLHMYYFKTDSIGNMQWSKRLNGGGCCGYGGGMTSVLETKDKNYMILGTEYCSICGGNTSTVYLAKINVLDTVIWENGFVFGEPSATDFQQTTDKGFIITGYFSGGAYLLKTDSTGNRLWQNKYTILNNAGTSVIQTKDGGYAMTSCTYPDKNMFLHKITSTGNLSWSKTYGDSTLFSITSQKVFLNSDNGFTIAASYTTSGVDGGHYLARTDSAGTSYCSEFSVTPTVSSFFGGNNAMLNKDTVGGCRAINFTTSTLITVDSILCQRTESIENVVHFSGVSITPNPFNQNAVLKIENSPENITIELFNSLGQSVRKIENITSDEIILQRESLSAGFFLLKISKDTRVLFIKKVIVTD